jgi:predicted metal-dependent HD superfamily phosphohydrolase
MIADSIQLTEEQTALLTMAAWLHDVGFRIRYKGHERDSCIAAREKLANVLNSEDMATIEEAIMGTEIPQRATHPISQALCDADLLYLGGNHFFDWSARLREEHLNVLGREYSDQEWIEYNIDFVRNHTYFTAFAQEHYGENLLKNLRALEMMRAASL